MSQPIQIPNGAVIEMAPPSTVIAMTPPSSTVGISLAIGPPGPQGINPGAQPRVTSIVSSATPVINVDTTDLFEITALATSVTSMTISGTPNQCQKLMIRIADGGIERAITWGSAFINSGIAALPASTRSAWAQSGAAQLNVSLMFDSYVPAWVAKAVGWW